MIADFTTRDRADASVHGLTEGKSAAPVLSKDRKWASHVFGKASAISKPQIRDITEIHESFACNLKNRLSANLQIPAEFVPTAVHELPYSEFTSSISKESYLATIGISPVRSQAILRLDAAVARAMIDLLLGGSGKPAQVRRRITEIEEGVLQIVVDMICEELQSVWQQFVKTNFIFGRSHRPAGLFGLIPGYEKVLSLNFNVRMADVSGVLTLAFPATVSSLLARKLAKRNSHSRIEFPVSHDRLKGKHQECVFTVEVLLPPTRIKGGDLLSLTPGQTLLIQHPLKRPAVVNVAGREMFLAYPVRNGGQRGAVIREQCSISSSDEVEK